MLSVSEATFHLRVPVACPRVPNGGDSSGPRTRSPGGSTSESGWTKVPQIGSGRAPSVSRGGDSRPRGRTHSEASMNAGPWLDSTRPAVVGGTRRSGAGATGEQRDDDPGTGRRRAAPPSRDLRARRGRGPALPALGRQGPQGRLRPAACVRGDGELLLPEVVDPHLRPPARSERRAAARRELHRVRRFHRARHGARGTAELHALSVPQPSTRSSRAAVGPR